MHKFVAWSRIGIFRNERTWSTQSDPKLLFLCVLKCLGAFGNVLLLHETWCRIGWTGTINAQVRAMKSPWIFFTTNTPDPPNWTLNSCFGAFRSISVHLAMFLYYTELGVKWVELVQLMHKFVAWSRIGIFRNERTWSTQSDPKLLFLCVSKCLGAFGNVSLLPETWSKIGWTGTINAQVRAMKSPWIFFATKTPNPPNWTQNACFGSFRSILVHLAMFRYYTKIGAKWVDLVQLMHMFVAWSRIGIFRNERTRSTPLDPKLMIWCILDCFVTARKSMQSRLKW